MTKTLVYYTASWCQPCKMFGPVIEQFVKDNNIHLVKLDVDKEPQLAQEDGVTSVPALVVYHDEKLVDRFIGAKPRPYLDKMLLPLLS